MIKLGEMTLEEAGRESAGNWQQFDCFAWDRQWDLEDADQWAILYTHNRDSGLLDQSNAAAIHEALEPFTEADDPDVVFESHSHWAVGHVDGFSIRVYRNGQITEAFQVYHELTESMTNYPVLNEEDHSRREYEATIENIGEAAWRLRDDYELPDGWEADVFSWFRDHRQSAIENRNDQGGYPEEDDLRAAYKGLSYPLLE